MIAAAPRPSLAADISAALAEPAPPGTAEDGLTVLLVEDDPMDSLAVSQLLHAASHGPAVCIFRVASVAEALRDYDRRKHDVVVADLTLPDAGGLMMVRILLSHDPDMALVVLTEREDQSMGEAAVRLGAQDYVTKGGLTSTALRRVVRYARGRKAVVRDSEERYRRIIEGAIDAVVITDSVGTIVEWNASAQTLFGWSRTEALGRHLSETVFKGTELGSGIHAKGACCMRTMTCAVPGSLKETTARRRDGSEFSVEIAVSAVGTNGSRLYTAFIRDVTERHRSLAERRAMEMQLVHAQKLESIGRLAGGVAHDFNNVLAAVMSFAELLLIDSPADDPRRPDVETILEAANRATGLTRQLLAFSRRQVFSPRVTDLNGLLAGIDRMLRRLIGEDVEVVTLFGEQLGLVEVDQGQIESAIVNLVVNARDAMPQGGTLTIETSNVDLPEAVDADALAGPAVRITVTDTGGGMSDAVLRHVFEPFFTTKEAGKGTGLGLASVYGIIKQSGGHVGVSSAPGAGTRFTIDLPRVRSAEHAGPGGAQQDVPGGMETILVAEDNVLVRRGLAATLSSRGYTVLQASNGEEAARIAEEYQGPIDLLLSDVVMPRMSGRALAERFAGLRPSARMIFMSGYMSESFEGSGVRISELVQKPFTTVALARKIRAALDEPFEAPKQGIAPF